MIRVFMDSSALFAAIVSSTGAARELVRLAVNEEIKLVISGDIITETRRNISLEKPRNLNRFSIDSLWSLISRWYLTRVGRQSEMLKHTFRVCDIISSANLERQHMKE